MEPEEPKVKNNSVIKDLVLFALFAIVIVIPIRMYIAQPFIVSGASMVPTFEGGQYLIVDQVSYNFHDPERGDVIVFKYPNDTSRFFIKRIVGLPGETIEIDNDSVFVTKPGDIQKTKLNEPYVTLNRETFMTAVLEDDEYFVMGDNRLASLDSRSWGPLQEDFIVGRAYLRLLPVGKADFLPGEFAQ